MYIGVLENLDLKAKLKRFVYDIIGCCQEVHSEKGPELTEYVYQDCLKIAFDDAHIAYKKEYHFHPTFRGRTIDSMLRVDFFCKEKVFLECKVIEQLSFHERIQLTNYMRNAGVRIGILYNFAPLVAECEKVLS
ncbi:MAG: GxxExxY protein [Bacteroidaceae bacterium]|nr:GxxExxY protein [Bacteroidaceae bacterium]